MKYKKYGYFTNIRIVHAQRYWNKVIHICDNITLTVFRKRIGNSGLSNKIVEF